MNDDLEAGRDLNFAELELNFDRFRSLARNPHLNVHERIGFPASYREGYEEAIFRDIQAKLPGISDQFERVIVDIGPGCANLPRKIIDLAERQRHRLILVDSAEMLDQLPNSPGVTERCVGSFPGNAAELQAMSGGRVDFLICYSVLHYMVVEYNPFDLIDRVADLLAPGGRALFGDIPNQSKRKRFFSSPSGVAFHQAFTQSDTLPDVRYNEPSPGKIDDAVLGGLIQRAQLAGCDAYLLPQPQDLPMANRRDDLLICKP